MREMFALLHLLRFCAAFDNTKAAKELQRGDVVGPNKLDVTRDRVNETQIGGKPFHVTVRYRRDADPMFERDSVTVERVLQPI